MSLSPEQIEHARQQRCLLCKARPGDPCRSIIDGQPMTRVHLARWEIRYGDD